MKQKFNFTLSVFNTAVHQLCLMPMVVSGRDLFIWGHLIEMFKNLNMFSDSYSMIIKHHTLSFNFNISNKIYFFIDNCMHV